MLEQLVRPSPATHPQVPVAAPSTLPAPANQLSLSALVPLSLQQQVCLLPHLNDTSTAFPMQQPELSLELPNMVQYQCGPSRSQDATASFSTARLAAPVQQLSAGVPLVEVKTEPEFHHDLADNVQPIDSFPDDLKELLDNLEWMPVSQANQMVHDKTGIVESCVNLSSVEPVRNGLSSVNSVIDDQSFAASPLNVPQQHTMLSVSDISTSTLGRTQYDQQVDGDVIARFFETLNH